MAVHPKYMALLRLHPTCPRHAEKILHAQEAFSMDTAKQARAICHNGMSITALQQQLQDLKGSSGLDCFIQCNPISMPTPVQEPASVRGLSLGMQGSCLDTHDWLMFFLPACGTTLDDSVVAGHIQNLPSAVCISGLSACKFTSSCMYRTDVIQCCR